MNTFYFFGIMALAAGLFTIGWNEGKLSYKIAGVLVFLAWFILGIIEAKY